MLARLAKALFDCFRLFDSLSSSIKLLLSYLLFSLAGNPKARADCELSKGAVGEARGTSAPTEMITQKGWRRFCLF